MAKIVLYIATTADGFIADKNGGLDWLPQTTEETEGEDFGYQEFLNSIDTILLGSKTYQQILTFVEQGHVPAWPYSGKKSYIFSKQPMHSNNPDIFFVANINAFLEIIKQKPEIKRIWLCGGAALIESFQQQNLLDEAIITAFPAILHEGIALPHSIYDTMKEIRSKEYKHQIIQKKYQRT